MIVRTSCSFTSVIICDCPRLLLQVSWSGEHKKVASGTRDVRFYDEDGFAAFRKVMICWMSGRDLSFRIIWWGTVVFSVYSLFSKLIFIIPIYGYVGIFWKFTEVENISYLSSDWVCLFLTHKSIKFPSLDLFLLETSHFLLQLQICVYINKYMFDTHKVNTRKCDCIVMTF